MPRGTKESEDEVEMKIGRRTRGIGALAVDSPLRRSTRNKQPVNHDDESSPESITSDATGASTRSTRRRTTAEYTLTDKTRSLRSRKNSTASDTTEFADNENPGDVKKRVTRRSMVTVQSVDTPTKSRLRPTTRAGSETKTMSPSVRTTRRTRASSVDLEENDDILLDKSSLTHIGTPRKPRSRASALPSEPSVIEETDISKEVTNKDENDTESISVSENSAKSPLYRLKLDENIVTHEQMEVEEIPIKESMTDTCKFIDNVFESSSNDPSPSPLKSNSELKDKLIAEMTDLPKIILYKTDILSQKSPGNKENEKLNIITPDKLLKISRTNSSSSERKSENFTSTQKLQLKGRLNKSVDENSLTTVENQSISILPSSINLTPSTLPKTSNDVDPLADTDVTSVAIASKNESIVFLGERIEMNEDTEFFNDNINEDTIHIEPKSQLNSSKNPLQESIKNISISEVDTTAEIFLNETTEFKNNDDISDDVKTDPLELSVEIEDNTKSDSNVTEASEHITQDNNECLSSSLSRNSTGENISITKSPVKILTEPQPETNEKTASVDCTDITEIQSESIVELSKETEENDEKTTIINKRRSSLNKNRSTPRRSLTPKSPSKVDKNDDRNDDDSEINVENLFHDISAEEWKVQHIEQSVIDDCNNADDEREEMNKEDAIFADKESWKISQKDRELKQRDTSDYDSDDTIIMFNVNTLSKYSQMEHNPVIVEESMDVDDDGDDDTEIDQGNKSTVSQSRRKSLLRNRRSSAASFNESNNKNVDSSKSPDGKTSLISKRRRSDGNNTTIQTIQGTDSTDTGKNSSDNKVVKNMSRKSLNIKSQDSSKDNKLKRRTIATMESTKPHESPRKSISTEDNVIDNNEDENDGQEKLEIAVKSPTNHKEQSLNVSTREKTPTSKLIDMDTDEDAEHPDCNASNQHKNSEEKSKLKKDNSTIVDINLELCSDERSSDSNDDANHSTIMPEFLFDIDTSDEESGSIDGDIAREFNLCGENISRYSDDDIPGDECRASETETSNDDDDDDDGNEMADFIVDDDEDIEDEESAEENEELENDEDKIDSSLKDNHEDEDEPNKSTDESKKRLKKKSKQLETSSSEDEEGENNKNESSEITETDVPRPSLSKKLIDEISMDSSTPKNKKRLSKKIVTPSNITSDSTDVDTSILNKSDSKTKSINKSIEIFNTPTNVVNTSKKLENSSGKTGKNEKTVNNSKVLRSKSLNDASSNQSLQITPTDSPEVKLLMKEKLNESLPALKLQRHSSKSSRRSSLMDVEEGIDEHCEEPPEETKIEHTECGDNIKMKKKKKKKKKNISVDNIVENTEIEESNILPVINDQTIGKKKKKKNLNHSETEILISKQEKLKKTKKQKEEVELVDKIPIVTKKMDKNKSQSSLEASCESLPVMSLKKTSTQSEAIKDNVIVTTKTKKKLSKNAEIKSDEIKIPIKQSNIKRLSDDILENLLDGPSQPNKRRKLNQQILPSKTMFDLKNSPPNNLSIEDVGYIRVSQSGGTSQFSVVNIKKFTKKRSKTNEAAWTFRERMLGRNLRQPVSAYLMYQQKMKASGKDKH